MREGGLGGVAIGTRVRYAERAIFALLALIT